LEIGRLRRWGFGFSIWIDGYRRDVVVGYEFEREGGRRGGGVGKPFGFVNGWVRWCRIEWERTL
jgi:hypothetical protein